MKKETQALCFCNLLAHSFEKVPLPLYRFAQERLKGSLFKALCIRVGGRLSENPMPGVTEPLPKCSRGGEVVVMQLWW